jgi:hypothetical protein
MPSVFLGTPTTRDFSPQYVTSLFRTQLKGALAFHTLVGQAIEIGRNRIVETFLANKMDYLLMHDSDATWHPGAVQRLVERGLPVVTGVIFKRSLPTVPTIGRDVGPSPSDERNHLYSFADTINQIQRVVVREKIGPETPNELLLPKHPDDLQEIDGCGAHFCLIRRDVLETIGKPWYRATGTNAGEDFDFCRRVKAAGFPLYVDYSVFTGHVLGPSLELGLREFLLFSDHKEINTLWMA